MIVHDIETGEVYADMWLQSCVTAVTHPATYLNKVCSCYEPRCKLAFMKLYAPSLLAVNNSIDNKFFSHYDRHKAGHVDLTVGERFLDLTFNLLYG